MKKSLLILTILLGSVVAKSQPPSTTFNDGGLAGQNPNNLTPVNCDQFPICFTNNFIDCPVKVCVSITETRNGTPITVKRCKTIAGGTTGCLSYDQFASAMPNTDGETGESGDPDDNIPSTIVTNLHYLSGWDLTEQTELTFGTTVYTSAHPFDPITNNNDGVVYPNGNEGFEPGPCAGEGSLGTYLDQTGTCPPAYSFGNYYLPPAPPLKNNSVSKIDTKHYK